MIQINLLPIRQIKQRIRVRNEVLVFFVAFLVLLGLLGLFATGMSQKVSTLHENIAKLNDKKQSYIPILNQIKKLEKDKEALDAKIDVIKKLKENSQITVQVLDQIALVSPANRLWLKSVKQSGNNVSLQGVALDNRTIAEYMKSLKASPVFSNAVLGKSSQVTVAGKKLKSFSLTLQTQNPGKEENSLQGKKK
ncbi:MAG TPA: pilus assembly protein PilN [Desulfobacterales bacterium]|nr:pilus assembly protein PilN [Desulfobacterales bacterium]